jgi:hypothetical protein
MQDLRLTDALLKKHIVKVGVVKVDLSGDRQ